MTTGTECRDCNLASKGTRGIYTLSCFKCRERFLLSEPCKVYREILAEGMKKWGETPNWKVDPNCGCKSYCERRQSVKAIRK